MYHALYGNLSLWKKHLLSATQTRVDYLSIIKIGYYEEGIKVKLIYL